MHLDRSVVAFWFNWQTKCIKYFGAYCVLTIYKIAQFYFIQHQSCISR